MASVSKCPSPMPLAPWTTAWRPATPPLRSHFPCTPQVQPAGREGRLCLPAMGLWDTASRSGKLFRDRLTAAAIGKGEGTAHPGKQPKKRAGGYAWSTEPGHFPATEGPGHHKLGILGLGMSLALVKRGVRGLGVMSNGTFMSTFCFT